jgi:hypothetical protein
MNLIVIPTYNTKLDNFQNIVNIKKKLPNCTVYVVDNSQDANPFESDFLEHDIVYEKSVFGGRYEPGALLQAYNRFDADKYLLIQDSIELVDESFVADYFKSNFDFIIVFQFLYPSYWFLTFENLRYLETIFTDAEDLLNNVFGFSHSSFLCLKQHIKSMVETEILSEKFLPQNKCEQQSWERVFGIYFGLAGFKLIGISMSGVELNDDQKKQIKKKWLVKSGRPLESFFIKRHCARA